MLDALRVGCGKRTCGLEHGGGIYRIHTILTTPPKEKIVLYVGDGLFFWFNTNARQHPGQLAVKRGERPAIIHDCYLNLRTGCDAPRPRPADRVYHEGLHADGV